MTNPIIEEVREARAALAAGHSYDPLKIYEWARAQHEARSKALMPSGPVQERETAADLSSVLVMPVAEPLLR